MGSPLALTLPPERDVEPGGWIRDAMAADLRSGFTGHLDALAPDLLVDDEIFGRDRLTAAVRAKDLGALSDDAAWSVQFLWWNAETQGNWRDGWLQHALWAGSPADRAAADAWVASILATQDADGYLGIYAPDLRFPEAGENGELWAQACLFRALLGYHRHTGDDRVLTAVRRAVDRTMAAYPPGASHPFGIGPSFGGVSHGLMFTDVCGELAALTGDARYLAYARWLYEAFSASPASDRDAAMTELQDAAVGFAGHGVHTYEHWRALVTAATAPDGASAVPYDRLLDAYAAKLEAALTPSGAPNGDEQCHAVGAADDTGYELCSVLELLAGYGLLARRTGDPVWGDRMEALLLNAGFGMRDPVDGGVAYLKTDNSRSMTGDEGFRAPAPGAAPQTRYRYSPVHREAAVCCVPNAGRLLPTYARHQWLLGEEDGHTTATAYLLGPSRVRLRVADATVAIAQTADYPATHRLAFTVAVTGSAPVDLTVAIRRPGWATAAVVEGIDSGRVRERDGFVWLAGPWPAGVTEVTVALQAAPALRPARGGSTLVGWGPLLFARPLPGRREVTRTYDVAVPGARFCDIAVHPAGETSDIVLAADADPRPCPVPDDSEAAAAPHAWQRQGLAVTAVSAEGVRRRVPLVPMGGTVLRQLTFTAEP